MSGKFGSGLMRRLPLVIVAGALIAVVAMALRFGASQPQIPWDISFAERGEGFVVQLTDEQRSRCDSATYSVLVRVREGYRWVLSDVPAQISESGEVLVPSDPDVLAFSMDDGRSSTIFRAKRAEGDELVFESDGMRLASVIDLSDVSRIGEWETVRLRVGLQPDGEVDWTEIDRASPLYPYGERVTEAELELYNGVGLVWRYNVGKTTADDGTMAAVEDWEQLDYTSFSLHPFIERFDVQTVPASQFDEEFLVQVHVIDSDGVRHSTDAISLQHEGTRNVEVPTESGKMTFDLQEDGAALESYEGQDAHVEVPQSVQGVKVVSIGECAFSGAERLREIRLPDSVASIGSQAFEDSGLVSFEVPSRLEYIGLGAFCHTASLGGFEQQRANGVTTVRDGVLYSADGKTLIAYPAGRGDTFEVPEGVKTIGYGAFAGCNVSEVKLPSSLKVLESCAFDGCERLQNVELPTGLRRIGSHAFGAGVSVASIAAGMHLASVARVHVGKDVSHIGYGAFSGLALESLEIDPANPLFKAKGTLLLSADDSLLEAIGAGSRPVEVPEGVVSLAARSLMGVGLSRSENPEGCPDIFLPNTLQAIEDGAFSERVKTDELVSISKEFVCAARFHAPAGSWAESYAQEHGIECDNIQDAAALSYEVREVVTQTATLTFRMYSDHAALMGIVTDGVGHVQIPSQVEGVPVTVIGASSYDRVSGEVKTLILPKSMERVEGSLLSGIRGLRAFELDEQSEHFRILEGALYSADGTELVAYPRDRGESCVVPAGTLRIGKRAFDHASVKEVILSDGLQRIEANAFERADIESIRIPGSVKSIGSEAFLDSKLLRIELSEGLESIGMRAYDNVVSLEGLSIPNSVRQIGDSAFGSSSLDRLLISTGSRELAIGRSVEFIGAQALCKLDVDAFDVDSANASYRSEGPFLLSKDGKRLVACAAGATGELFVPEGVESLEDGVFAFAGRVTDVHMPASVLRISGMAFGKDAVESRTIALHCVDGSEAASVLDRQGIPWTVEVETP